MDIQEQKIGWQGDFYWSGRFWYVHNRQYRITGVGSTQDEARTELNAELAKARNLLESTEKSKKLKNVYKSAVLKALEPGKQYSLKDIYGLISDIYASANHNTLYPYLKDLVQEGRLQSVRVRRVKQKVGVEYRLPTEQTTQTAS